MLCAHCLCTWAVPYTLSAKCAAFQMADCFESLTTTIPLSHKESLQTGGPENAWGSSGTLGRNTSILMKNMQARVQLLSDVDRSNLEHVQITFKSMPFCQGTGEVPHGLYLKVWICSKDHEINNWKWASMNELELDFDDLNEPLSTQDILILWF